MMTVDERLRKMYRTHYRLDDPLNHGGYHVSVCTAQWVRLVSEHWSDVNCKLCLRYHARWSQARRDFTEEIYRDARRRAEVPHA